MLLSAGLGVLAVGAAALVTLMNRMLGHHDSRDLLAIDEVERGGGEPIPRPRGRHRAAP